MSGKSDKRARRIVKDAKVNVLKEYIADIKGLKFWARRKIAWGIVRGKVWQAELVFDAFLILIGLACVGVFQIVKWILG